MLQVFSSEGERVEEGDFKLQYVLMYNCNISSLETFLRSLNRS